MTPSRSARTVLVAAVAAAPAATAVADLTAWSGAVDGSFFDPARWTNGVPQDGDSAILDVAGAQPYTVTFSTNEVNASSDHLLVRDEVTFDLGLSWYFLTGPAPTLVVSAGFGVGCELTVRNDAEFTGDPQAPFRVGHLRPQQVVIGQNPGEVGRVTIDTDTGAMAWWNFGPLLIGEQGSGHFTITQGGAFSDSVFVGGSAYGYATVLPQGWWRVGDPVPFTQSVDGEGPVQVNAGGDLHVLGGNIEAGWLVVDGEADIRAGGALTLAHDLSVTGSPGGDAPGTMLIREGAIVDVEEDLYVQDGSLLHVFEGGELFSSTGDVGVVFLAAGAAAGAETGSGGGISTVEVEGNDSLWHVQDAPGDEIFGLRIGSYSNALVDVHAAGMLLVDDFIDIWPLGTLRVGLAGTVRTGSLILLDGGTLDMSGGTLEIDGGTLDLGDAPLWQNPAPSSRLRLLNGATAELQSLGPANHEHIEVRSGSTLEVAGAVSVSSPSGPGSSLTIDGGSSCSIDGTLQAGSNGGYGTITISDGSTVSCGWLSLDGISEVVVDDATLQLPCGALYASDGSLIVRNGGTLLTNASVCEDPFPCGFPPPAAPNEIFFSASVTIDGAMWIEGCHYCYTDGFVTIRNGSIVDVRMRNEGFLSVSDSTLIGDQLLLDTGSLSGNPLIQGDLLNEAGSVHPGGTMTVQGSYEQQEQGRLSVEIDEADLLDVSGTATLAGQLRALFDFAQPPVPGEEHVVLLADQVTGAFETFVSNHSAEVIISPDRVTVVALPPVDCNGNGLDDVYDIYTEGAFDCDGDGVPDECQIASGEASDVNGNGAPDFCEGDGTTTSIDGLDAGESAIIVPGGDGEADPFVSPLLTMSNLWGPDAANVTASQSEDDPHADAGGFIVAGTSVEVTTSLPDGSFLLQLSVPFDLDQLGGGDPLAQDLAFYDEMLDRWRLAVAGNTAASPGHGGPIGDRFEHVGANVPSLSDDLGDHGVAWDPTAGRGFVWANVDHTTIFRAGFACAADTNGDALVGVDDLVNVVLDWGTAGAENGGDVDGSGVVDVGDLIEVITGWGSCTG